MPGRGRSWRPSTKHSHTEFASPSRSAPQNVFRVALGVTKRVSTRQRSPCPSSVMQANAIARMLRTESLVTESDRDAIAPSRSSVGTPDSVSDATGTTGSGRSVAGGLDGARRWSCTDATLVSWIGCTVRGRVAPNPSERDPALAATAITGTTRTKHSRARFFHAGRAVASCRILSARSNHRQINVFGAAVFGSNGWRFARRARVVRTVGARSAACVSRGAQVVSRFRPDCVTGSAASVASNGPAASPASAC